MNILTDKMKYGLILPLSVMLIQCHAKVADFHYKKVVSKIAFGSCNKHDRHQPLWSSILSQDPDLWIWLGDVVYADTRLVPFIWMVSSLESMKHKYDLQKQVPGYKKLLDSNTSVIGVWDDHDYGIDGGGKHFKYRHQSQTLFLDFLDEPMNSVRRNREGMYVSYSYGDDDKIVKIILLDVRSHHVKGYDCDILGNEQWQWLREQLDDETANLILIGSGKQVLSDIPFIDKWMSCQASLDRLIWMVQKREKVIFLSGDVHFSEVNCLNASGTGYPFYELTSSGMTHTCSFPVPHSFCVWTLKNVVASRYRTSNVVTDKSYGYIHVDWESKPIKLSFKLMGENSKELLHSVISLEDLTRARYPTKCPIAVEQPNWYWKRVFWCSVVGLGILLALILIRIVFLVGRWVALEMLKDLDMKIKRRMKKLRLSLTSNLTSKNKDNKLHKD